MRKEGGVQQTTVEKEYTDIQLVERIKSGDMTCFEILVDRHKNYAFTIADRILLNDEDAEEVAHDAFVKLITALDKFKSESKFTTWFYRIVMNMAISRTRKKKIRTEDFDSSTSAVDRHSSFEEFDGLNKEDRSHYLNLAISQLKEEDRVLITLYYFEELEMDEIVEITNIDKGNVKVKIFRARKKLGNHLKKLLPRELESIL